MIWQYVGETGGYYVSVKPDADSCSLLMDWAVHLGFWLKPDDMDRLHCTVIYTQGARPEPAEAEPTKTFSAVLRGFTHWGGFDGQGYVVALIDSADIVERRLQWIDRGSGVLRPDFKPHVTLQTGLPCSAALAKRMQRLSDKVRGTPLIFSRECLKDV